MEINYKDFLDEKIKKASIMGVINSWELFLKERLGVEYGMLILKKLIDKIELDYMIIIEDELSSDGKKLFSNENKRKVELLKRLKIDSEYLIYKERLTELTIELREVRIKEEYSRKMMEMIKLIANPLVE